MFELRCRNWMIAQLHTFYVDVVLLVISLFFYRPLVWGV